MSNDFTGLRTSIAEQLLKTFKNGKLPDQIRSAAEAAVVQKREEQKQEEVVTEDTNVA